MSATLVSIIGVVWLFIAAGCWLGWQLLRQNGRMLLRLDELEKRLYEFEFAETGEPTDSRNGESDRANRFNNRSLARSKIKRDGLKAGTAAPDFRLPCLDGTEHSLQDFRCQRVLLVFSDPHCGPCQALAPDLQKFYRTTLQKDSSRQPSPPATERGTNDDPAWETGTAVVMISRGEPRENRAKVNEHGLTFPVLLQQSWEISRLYAMFATPVAYLIDERGLIARDVAVGVEPIQSLLTYLSQGQTREGAMR